MARSFLWVIGLGLLLVGCGGSDDSPEPESGDSVRFTAELNVAPGAETVQCKFVAMPADRGELAVGRIQHHYTNGSHHFLLFRTQLTEIPAGGDVLTECNEGDRGWMGEVRGVVYAAQDPEGGFDYPEGVGVSFEPGEVMLFQSHYINTSQSELAASVNVDLELSDPATLTDEAGVLFFYNPQIVVPPNGGGTATLNCPVKQDINLVFAASHMHKRGLEFRATTDDSVASNAAGGMLYQTENWSEPVPRVYSHAPPLTIHAGSNISYSCEYGNADPFTVVQGPSAEVNEMCMFVGTYWPRADQKLEWCYDGTTGMGGKASAEETLKCLITCGQDNADCSAGCWQNACPNVPMKISQSRDCLPACAGSCLGGLTSDACAACANDLCPDAYAELVAARCD